MDTVREFQVSKLPVKIYKSELEMGQAAANDIADCLIKLLSELPEVNVMFAAAVSQATCLDSLIKRKDIDWARINAFNMDEYVGLSQNDTRSLAYFLTSRHLLKIPLKSINFINGEQKDQAVECSRYSRMLENHPINICIMGIGDNGHLAFNDPHVAAFNDTAMIKMVDIDNVSKQQQVNARNFDKIENVPSFAYTVTIPGLLLAKRIFCIAPTVEKARAVHDTLYAPMNTSCPATILRNCENATLYLESGSASLL